MTPFDVNSKIIASKRSIPEEKFYEDPIAKFKDVTKPKNIPKQNSVIANSGYKTNPENFRRSPMRVSRAAPLEGSHTTQKELRQQAHEHFDNDATFVAYNSDMYRYHSKKV